MSGAAVDRERFLKYISIHVSHSKRTDMRTIFFLMAFLVLGASAAMAQVEGTVGADGNVVMDTPAGEDADGMTEFGEPMPDIMEKFRLAEVADRFEELAGVEMQITGTAQPCPDDNCWMLLQDGGAEAKMMLVNHDMNISMDLTGKEITVFGMLEPHMEADPNQVQAAADDVKPTFHIIVRSVRVRH